MRGNGCYSAKRLESHTNLALTLPNTLARVRRKLAKSLTMRYQRCARAYDAARS